MILGTVTAIDSINGLRVTIDGEEEATTKKYTYVSSYVPNLNDRVIIEEIGGSYVIMGKIISDFSSSGIVRQADSATNATNAQNAINATNATNAITSESCSGNAETATSAKRLENQQTIYGGVVTNVQSRYSSELGMTVVTDVAISRGNFLAV